MIKIHHLFFYLSIVLINYAFSVKPKKVIYLEKLDVTVVDSTFTLEKVLIIKNQDSIKYDIYSNQKRMKFDMTKSFKLLLVGKNDTLELNDLKKTFEERENFSLRIEIPQDYDYCYYLAYMENQGEEMGFLGNMGKKSSQTIDNTRKCISVYIDSHYN